LRFRLTVASVACVSPLWAGEARVPLQLAWSAPESCPDQVAVVRQIEHHLGYGLDSPPGPDGVVALVAVSAQPEGGFRLHLHTTFRGEVRERAVDGDSCGAVADAAALMLAFLIDPEAAAPEAKPEPEPEPERAEPPPVVIAPKPAGVTAPEPDAPKPEPSVAASGPSWFLAAAFGIDTGALPEPTTSVGGALGIELGRLALEASFSRYSPQEQRLAGDATRGGNFELWALGARSCYSLRWAATEVGPCLGLEGGTVFGSGFGVDTPGQGKGLWLAAAAELSGRYRASSWLGVRTLAGVAAPFTRPVYVLDNVGTVYQADFITFRGTLGLEAYF
jgi:hypothetical protein